ncbi:MAG TPA: MFS transporter [Acidimicrobiales bacterium]|nr:MFS transporter [Acidimicrobiales bacterium]
MTAKPSAVAGNGAPAGDHVEAVHRAEAAVEEIEHSQEALRERARTALGITGSADQAPPLREGIRRTGVGWYPLMALSVLVVVDEFQSYAISIMGPEISRTLGISKSTLAFLVLLKTLSIMLASLPIAAYVQHKPRRAAISIVAAFGWGLMTLFTGLVKNVWGLLAMLVADGATTGTVHAVHRPLLVDTYPPEVRVRGLSFYRAGGAVGTVIAPLYVGLLSAVFGFTWRGVFLVMGLTCLVAALVAVRLRDPGLGRWDTERVRELVRDEEGGDKEAVSEDDARLRFFEIVRRLMLIPTIRRVLAAWAALGMLIFPLYTFLFFFLDEEWNLGPGARSLFFAAAWAFSLPALAWFGRRGEALFREDPAKLVRFTSWFLVVFAVAVAVGVASPVLVGTVLGFGVVFAMAALLLPALSIVMLSIVPPLMRPHASALGGIFLAGVGGIGGLLLLNGIDRRFGVGGAVVSLAVPGVLAALLMRRAAATVNADLDRMIDEIVEAEEIRALTRRGVHLPMLTCRHIDFSYGHLQVLFDVDFTVDDGEMVALLGTNGAGKSSLLRVISGLGLPSRGSIHLRGTDITYLDAERRVQLGITQVPGGRAVFGPLSVVDNLLTFGHTHGRDRKAVERGIEAAFDAFPRLAERRNQPASTLSGGEQQMLGLSKAFIMSPRILLIDELSLGLAPKVVGELLDMVQRINAAGTAIVLVEQSVNIALSLVDHAYFMEKGEIRFDGRASELLARPDLLRSVFLEGATKGLA